jgi:hypothetical protein
MAATQWFNDKGDSDRATKPSAGNTNAQPSSGAVGRADALNAPTFDFWIWLTFILCVGAEQE